MKWSYEKLHEKLDEKVSWKKLHEKVAQKSCMKKKQCIEKFSRKKNKEVKKKKL